MKKKYFLAASLFVLYNIKAQQTQSFLGFSKGNQIVKKTKDTSTLFQQEITSGGGVLSDMGPAGGFVAITDDFKLEEAASVEKLTFSGFQVGGNFLDHTKGFLMYIYANKDGRPAGIPQDTNPYIAKVDLDETSNAYSIKEIKLDEGGDDSSAEYYITIDLKAANGVGLNVQANTTYWVVFVAKIDVDDYDYETRWHWYSGTLAGEPAKLVDPQNAFGADLTDWTDISKLVGGDLFSGLAFNIVGQTALGTKELYSTIKDVSVAQDGEQLYIFTKNKNLQSSEIYSTDGKKVLSATGSKINISILNKGVYFVNVKTNDGKVSSTKFIKR